MCYYQSSFGLVPGCIDAEGNANESEPRQPPRGAARVRLLDDEDENVFLATVDGDLHATTVLI